MSREIKFRIWDRYLKKMLYPVLDKYISSDGRLVILFESSEEDYSDFGDTEETSEWSVGDDNHIEILQYTGLKDSKGKKIYEGDIVKFKWEVGDLYEFKSDEEYEAYLKQLKLTYIGVVEADVGGSVNMDIKAKHSEIPAVVYFNIHTAKKGEVIGNIFENPELLDQ